MTKVTWILALFFNAIASICVATDIEAQGLVLNVAPFEIGSVHYEGGSITAFPDKAQYLVLNLHTKTLHLLERSIGDDSVLLAELKTSADSVQNITIVEPVLPKTRIPETLQKIGSSEPLRVHCFGSSLVAAGTSSTGWQKLLFYAEYASDPLSVLQPNEPDAISNRNYGVGGTNARYTIALLGEGIAGDERYETSAYDCDLAIVALLPNGGVDRLPVFESVVRQLRERGIEVLLLTDNSMANKGRATGLWGNGNFVRELADKYGCGIADTAAYMLEAETLGDKVYADSIHSSQLGHRQWALAASGALTPIRGLPVDAFSAPADAATIEDASCVPSTEIIDFRPDNQGGEYKEPVGSNGLAKAYGMDPPGALVLDAGDSFVLNQDGFIAADFIFSVDSGFTAEVRAKDAKEPLRIIEYKAPKIGPRPQAKAIIAASEGLGAIQAGTYTVTITSGSIKLFAVCYQMP